MTSPLVTKLLAGLSASADPVERAVLSAELGCYWARVGEFEESEKIRLELRRGFGDGRSPRVSILIMVIEALQLYYGNLNPTARDRMLRANLLSKSFSERGLVALTSAWMAHFEFNRARFDLMAVELRTCVDALHSEDESAECRAALVFGDAYLLAGRHPQSQAWYERARLVASRTGDHAALGAMTYNRAALRVARVRYERLSGQESGVDASLLHLDVQSAVNYQSIARLRSLDHLLTTARVGLLLLHEKTNEAAPLIEELLASADVAAISAQRTILNADYALVLAASGRAERAEEQIDLVQGMLTAQLPTDDLCLVLGSLRGAASVLGDDAKKLEIDEQLRGAVAKHELVTTGVRESLAKFESAAN